MEKIKYPLFQNYGQLLKALPTNEIQKEFLAQMRWNGEPVCIHCDKKEFVRIYTKPGFYECSSCKIQFSVLQGTIFERSPIPLDTWFWAIFEFCAGLNSSPVSAMRHTVEQKTAWKMNMRIRETLWEELNTKLSGTIHCDETELGADPQGDLRVFHRKRIRKKNGLPADHFMEIFGMVEVGKTQKEKPKKDKKAVQGGRVLLFTIDNKELNTLQEIMIRKTNAEDSKFITDGYKSYFDFRFWCRSHIVLNKSEFGKYDFRKYVRKVNPYTHEVAKKNEIAAGQYITLHNNPIENVWSKLSLDYRRYYGFSKEYAQLYLNEFMFRWNHDHLKNGERFMILLERCLRTPLYEGFGKKRKKIALKNKFALMPINQESSKKGWVKIQ